MKIGDAVVFWITGCVPLYRGVVTTLEGKRSKPEIRVTHRKAKLPNVWIPDKTWPILKDGDYIIREDKDAESR